MSRLTTYRCNCCGRIRETQQIDGKDLTDWLVVDVRVEKIGNKWDSIVQHEEKKYQITPQVTPAREVHVCIACAIKKEFVRERGESVTTSAEALLDTFNEIITDRFIEAGIDC